MSQEQKYLASKFQALLKEHGQLLEMVVAEIKKEYDEPINEETAEKIGLEYAKCLAGKNALTRLMQKLNNKANERN